jgi:hypothetical protein
VEGRRRVAIAGGEEGEEGGGGGRGGERRGCCGGDGGVGVGEEAREGEKEGAELKGGGGESGDEGGCNLRVSGGCKRGVGAREGAKGGGGWLKGGGEIQISTFCSNSQSVNSPPWPRAARGGDPPHRVLFLSQSAPAALKNYLLSAQLSPSNRAAHPPTQKMSRAHPIPRAIHPPPSQ